MKTKFLELSDPSLAIVVNLENVACVRHEAGLLCISLLQGQNPPPLADEDCVLYARLTTALGVEQ